MAKNPLPFKPMPRPDGLRWGITAWRLVVLPFVALIITLIMYGEYFIPALVLAVVVVVYFLYRRTIT